MKKIRHNHSCAKCGGHRFKTLEKNKRWICRKITRQAQGYNESTEWCNTIKEKEDGKV